MSPLIRSLIPPILIWWNVCGFYSPFPPFYSVLVAPSGVLKRYQAPPQRVTERRWQGTVIFQELAGRLVWGSCISINRSSISISKLWYIYTPGDDFFPLPLAIAALLLLSAPSCQRWGQFPFLLPPLSPPLPPLISELLSGVFSRSAKVLKVLTSGVC